MSAAVVLTLGVGTAHADQMDFALERLVLTRNEATGEIVTGPCTNSGRIVAGFRCAPDDKSFKRLVNQYAMVLAPTAMHSARTTGFGGFHLSIETAITSIDKDADYWQQGTQGTQDTSSKKNSIRNASPPGSMQTYLLKIRKGFPFGLEMTGNVGYVGKTNLVIGGADVRMSLLEGFRTGPLGILPDVAAGGGVRTLTGTPQVQLTIASFDVQISKPLPIADSNIITPYVGFQYLWIFGDSGLIDTTPNTDAVGYCGYNGSNVPGNADPSKAAANGAVGFDGQPVCRGGSGRDFNNTFVFNPVRLHRQRLILGLSYRYEMVAFSGQFMTDIVDPKDANSGQNKTDLDGVKRQTTAAFEIGAMF